MRGRPAHDRLEGRQRAGSISGEAGMASTTQAQQQRDEQRHEAEQHQPVGDRSAVKFGDRARGHDQQQEGEDTGLDRERAERDLLVAEHARDAHHAAVEDGEGEQGRGMADGGCGCALRSTSGHGAKA